MIIFFEKLKNDLEKKIDQVISIKFKSEKKTIKKNSLEIPEHGKLKLL